MSGYVRIPLVVVLSMMLAVLVPHFCSADTPPKEMMNEQDTMPVYHLGEIVVVRGKKNVPKSSLSEISTEVFRAHGTNTVKEVLTATPGVVVTSGSKGESRIQIRGFQSEETMILLDGRPINLPYYGETDLNMIPISNLSKIKVVKGPAAAVYGANTLGGLVNMISKRMKGVAVRDLRLSVGGNDTYDAEINFGARYGDLDYWVSLGYARSDGWNLSDDFVSTELEDGDLRDTSAHRTYNLDGKLNYTLRNGTVFSLSAGYYDAERGLPVATETPRPRFQRFPEWKRYYLDLSGEGFVSSRLHWRGKMYGDVAKNRLIRYSDASFSEDQVVFDSYHDSFDLGSRFVFTYQFHQDLSNTFGVSLRKDGIDRRISGLSRSVPHTTVCRPTPSMLRQDLLIPMWV